MTWFARKKPFNMKQRANLYGDLARFMAAGVTPFDVFEKMRVIAHKSKRKARQEAAFGRVSRQLKAGKKLSKTLGKEVPRNEAAILVSAEEAGYSVLEEVIARMAQALTQQLEVKAEFAKVVRGNSITLFVLLVVMLAIMIILVPMLQSTVMPGMASSMPFATAYFAMGQWTVGHLVWLAIAAVSTITWTVWSLPRWHINRPWWSRSWFDRFMVPWTLYARTQATQFLTVSSALMQAGTPLLKVVEDMIPYASAWQRSKLKRIKRALGSGRNEVESLDVGLLPKDIHDRLATYALVQDFSKVMPLLAEDNFTIYKAKVGALNAGIKTATTLALVIFVLVTMFAVFDYTRALVSATSVMGF